MGVALCHQDYFKGSYKDKESIFRPKNIGNDTNHSYYNGKNDISCRKRSHCCYTVRVKSQ